MGLNPLSDAAVELVKDTVGKVVGNLTDHYLPPSMTEAERAQFAQKAQELALEEIKLAQQSMSSVNTTMQAEAKSEHWMQWAWRPTVGFTFAFVILNNYILIPYFYWLKPVDIPMGVWNDMLIVLGVAAGTRGIQKIQEAKSQATG